MLAQVLAQISVSPNASPTLNSGGWVYGAAILLGLVGALIAGAIVFGYMRFAPRFETAPEGARGVKAPRLSPGGSAPRRPVNVTGSPVVVPAPVSVGAAVGAPAAVAPVAVAAPAPAAAAVAAPAAPAASAPAAPVAAENAAPAAPAAAPAEKHEVELDKETFEATLAELLAKGTDRRVAEGQARRAAMIAARKKAGA